MIVKHATNPISTLQSLLARQNGMLLTSDLAKLGIHRVYLSVLEKNGEIERISRGVYAAANSLVDEMASLQAKCRAAIFSHETALYLWELTDRSPLFFSVTVPSGYNATTLKSQGNKVYFVHRDLHPLGQVIKKTPHGHTIQTYDLERTLCDVLRNRNQIDIQFVTLALKRYVRRTDKNVDRLFDYAGRFRIQKIVRTYMEVLL